MLSPDTLSVQLFTLRDRLATEPDSVFADLADIGLTQVAASQGGIPILDYVAASPSARLSVIELDESRTDVTRAVRDSFIYLSGR